MVLPGAAFADARRPIVEYRSTGERPARMTPQRTVALAMIGARQGMVRELAALAEVSDAVIRGLVQAGALTSEEHTSELQSLMRISYAVFCLKQKTTHCVLFLFSFFSSFFSF